MFLRLFGATFDRFFQGMCFSLDNWTIYMRFPDVANLTTLEPVWTILTKFVELVRWAWDATLNLTAQHAAYQCTVPRNQALESTILNIWVLYSPGENKHTVKPMFFFRFSILFHNPDLAVSEDTASRLIHLLAGDFAKTKRPRTFLDQLSTYLF